MASERFYEFDSGYETSATPGSVGTPTNDEDLVTKQFLDSQIAALLEKSTKSYTDFSVAALTTDIEAFSVTDKVISAVLIKHTASFSGTGITDLTFTVGITGELDRYVQLFDATVSPSSSEYVAANLIEPIFGGPTSVRVSATAVGANLDQLSQGSVDVYLLRFSL